jgi:hypothetical protein
MEPITFRTVESLFEEIDKLDHLIGLSIRIINIANAAKVDQMNKLVNAKDWLYIKRITLTTLLLQEPPESERLNASGSQRMYWEKDCELGINDIKEHIEKVEQVEFKINFYHNLSSAAGIKFYKLHIKRAELYEKLL